MPLIVENNIKQMTATTTLTGQHPTVTVIVTVNGLRYREMINDFFWPELDGIDLGNVYFQQDGATCHTSNEIIDLLWKSFRTAISLEELITIGHRDLVI